MTAPLPALELEVVICTYDNPLLLDRVLAALGRQRPAGGRWGVTVVTNNSGDDTRAVVEQHLERAEIPSLRRVDEPRQGLTPARLRGVASTTAPWIAFVDDDCLVDEHWIERAIAFARSQPGCAGFGGRVVPTYVEEPPAVLAGYGWAFAEQDLGDVPVTVECLVGAGMVVNRAALEASGWTEAPYFADRVGQKLVSGGDVEIALRLAGTGRPLWYTPSCEIRHVIPPHRTTMPYLVRMTRGLGASWALARALTWSGSRRSWARSGARDLATSLLAIAWRARRGARSGQARQDIVLAASYEWGRWQGTARVAALAAAGRCEYFGGARPRPLPSRSGDHAVRAG